MLILLNVKCEIHTGFYIQKIFLLKYSYSCMNTAFSNIFENAGNSDIGIIIEFMWVFFFY